jgi:HNH endonuclease
MENENKWLHQGHIYTKRDGRTVAEHRVILEDKLGRPLRWDEVCHHRDNDPLNNDPENLAPMTRAEHLVHHLRSMPLVPWTDEELDRAIELKKDGRKIDDIAIALGKSYYATRRRLAKARKAGRL